MSAHRRAATALAVVALAFLPGCGAPPSDVSAPSVAVPAAPTGDLTKTDVDAWLDGSLPGGLDRAGIAGAAVTVVKDGEILTNRGFGYADTGTDADGEIRPVDPDTTLFRIGSVSKLFTDTAALRLVQEGELDLDTDVNEYLDFTVPEVFDRKLTLRHLLTHTPGFEEAVADLLSFSGGSPKLRDVVSVDPPEQIYEPGTVPAYSNYGNALVGYLVERASGMPFADYVDKYVYRPLDMDASTFAQPLPRHLRDDMSRGYTVDTQPAGPFEVVKAFPAGAMSATPDDMARFMLAQLGELDAEHSPLNPKTLKLMHEPALDADTLDGLAAGPRMTLGFFDESRNGHRILGHGGDTDLFHSHLQLYPEERTGIFITMNSAGHDSYDTHELRSSVLEGFADRYFPAEDTDVPAATDTAREHAALAEGSYDSSRTFRSTFMSTLELASRTTVTARGDGTIVLDPGPAAVRPAVYREVEPWLWQEVGGQRRLSMRVEDGAVTAIGFESAFTLLPVAADRQTGPAVTVLVSAVAVMLITLVATLIATVRRRFRKLPARAVRGRWARILTRIAMGANLVAVIGWLLLITAIMGYADLSDWVIRAVQLVQLAGILGLIPAGFVVFHAIRDRARLRVVTATLGLLALAGMSWFANTFMLLAPSITY